MPETESDRVRALEIWSAGVTVTLESDQRWRDDITKKVDALRLSAAKLTGVFAVATCIGGLLMKLLLAK